MRLNLTVESVSYVTAALKSPGKEEKIVGVDQALCPGLQEEEASRDKQVWQVTTRYLLSTVIFINTLVFVLHAGSGKA